MNNGELCNVIKNCQSRLQGFLGKIIIGVSKKKVLWKNDNS